MNINIFPFEHIFANLQKLYRVLSKIQSYFLLVKFSHTIFALPFALLGFTMAIFSTTTDFQWGTLIFIVLCMIFARNAAMSFNRYCDREFDKKNPRTAMREIPKGTISVKNSLTFTIVNSVLFILCAGFFNKTTLILSPIALAIILFYSYTKRFTSLSHFVLGLGLSIAPAGAYLAIVEQLNLSIIILSGIVLLWTAGFDILYSLQDEEFDKENHLFSIPAKFGRKKSLIISAAIHLICIICLVFFTILLESTYIMWIGTVIFTVLLVYQHLIIKTNDISRVNLAFGTLNGIASFIFSSIAIIEIIYTA
ncbi:MAG: putative 4-hydroxybenzoate polyprenyltransferase [Bacteroidales bacterium]|nr:putative 4-hydroxybenzoate polyprenyltransferase [Bacteroidales bacterium]